MKMTMMMDGNRGGGGGYWRSYILCIYLCVAATTFCMQCAEGRKLGELSNESTTGMNMLKRFGIVMPVLDSSSSSSNTQPYGVASPFNLPPYECLPPFPLPDNAPPFYVYPPQPPSSAIPTPTPVGGAIPSPPSTTNPTPTPAGGVTPSPPFYAPELPNPSPPTMVPNPPATISSPPEYVPSPPISFPSPSGPVLSPPFSEPSPPSYTPSPSIIVPSPPPPYIPRTPVFLPPIVYPPPAVAPPHERAPPMALWCVAKPSVPEPIIQEAMNYACASGADCDQIEPNGSCYEPDTVLAHASYAFNSYWQRTKVAGGTCHFGGAAILVTVDPSYDGCHFLYL